jgi:hypothetical protein
MVAAGRMRKDAVVSCSSRHGLQVDPNENDSNTRHICMHVTVPK